MQMLTVSQRSMHWLTAVNIYIDRAAPQYLSKEWWSNHHFISFNFLSAVNLAASHHVSRSTREMSREIRGGTRSKRAAAAAEGADERPAREQKTTLAKSEEEVSTNFNNVRDILGRSSEELCNKPAHIGVGVLDAMRQLANMVSTISALEVATPAGKKLRGWVECCVFVEKACRSNADAVAGYVARTAQHGGGLLNCDGLQPISHSLVLWACRARGVEVADDESDESLRKKLGATEPYPQNEAGVEANAPESQPPTVNMLGLTPEDGDGDEETDDVDEGGAKEVQELDSASADVHWIVPHEEVGAAGSLTDESALSR